MTNMEARGLAKGERVQAAVHTDRWMMGDRYGTVESVSHGNVVVVRMDRSNRVVRFAPCNLEFVA